MPMDHSYQIIRSGRKTAAIQITPEGQVILRCPHRMSREAIRSFVQSKSSWIEAHLTRQAALPRLPQLTEAQLQALTEEARKVISARVSHFAPAVGVTWERITLRRQHTRWGSCSAKGNLSFNCLLMLAPPEVLDYVVVHELCHRKQMNHSAAFWAEVERILPNYRSARQWLKDHGSALILRLPK